MTFQQRLKLVKEVRPSNDLEEACKYCFENGITYAEMQVAETCALLKEEEKARERMHQRENLFNY